MNRSVYTDEGLRALSGESPIHPESVQKYLESKFGDALENVSKAMLGLAKSLPPSQLAKMAYTLYEKFRPEIPPGKKGWGRLRQAEPEPHLVAESLVITIPNKPRINPAK